MRLKFDYDPESGEYYAVADNVVYNEQLCDSLWYAELIPNDQGFICKWDDDFRNKVQFSTLEAAKEYVLKHHSMHKPQVVGRRYDLN